MSSSASSSSTPQGLTSYGRTSAANTAFQCLKALDCVKELGSVELIKPDKPTYLWKLMVAFKTELTAFSAGKARSPKISVNLLKLYAQQIQSRYWHDSQDVKDFLYMFFTCVTHHATEFLFNFTLGGRGAGYVPDWAIRLYVPDTVSHFNLARALEKAVTHRAGGSDCSCGEEKLHLHGELPSCLIVIVNRFDQHERIRSDVTLDIKDDQLVAGQRYKLKSAAQYVGLKTGRITPSELARGLKSAGKMLKKPFSSGPSPNVSGHRFSKPGAGRLLPVKFTAKSRDGSRPYDGMKNGQWSAYVRQGKDWFLVDDEQVKKVDVVKTNDLFVFFYERVVPVQNQES